MAEAKLNMWNNNWFDVYDFTPRKFNAENYQCIESEGRYGNNAQVLSMLQKYNEKIQDFGLEGVPNMVPRCMGTKGIETTGYIVVAVDPFPAAPGQLHCFHSRISACPAELRAVLKNELSSNKILFAKIAPAWLGKWQSHFHHSIKQVFKSEEAKEILESTVFIPFRDEH